MKLFLNCLLLRASDSEKVNSKYFVLNASKSLFSIYTVSMISETFAVRGGMTKDCCLLKMYFMHVGIFKSLICMLCMLLIKHRQSRLNDINARMLTGAIYL